MLPRTLRAGSTPRIESDALARLRVDLMNLTAAIRPLAQGCATYLLFVDSRSSVQIRVSAPPSTREEAHFGLSDGSAAAPDPFTNPCVPMLAEPPEIAGFRAVRSGGGRDHTVVGIKSRSPGTMPRMRCAPPRRTSKSPA